MDFDYQSNSFRWNKNQTRYLVKMHSSSNLYDYLMDHNDDDDNSDNDLSIGTNPITMTSSTSSDSAIVSDEIDDLESINDKQIKHRNSWPKMFKNTESTLVKHSKSIHLSNQSEQQTIYDNQILIPKYKQPLPWNTDSNYYHVSSNKVEKKRKNILLFSFFKIYLREENKCDNLSIFFFFIFYLGSCNTCS